MKMEINEALQILSINDIEDAEDAFDDQFFEYKSFFLSKVPFTKLFSSKLNRLSRINDAKNTLIQKEVQPYDLDFPIIEIDDDLSVKETVKLFHQNQNEIKRRINNSKTFEEIVHSIDVLLKNYTDYAKKWLIFDEVEIHKNVKMSIEPDTMSILASVNSFNALGLTLFNEIIQLENENLLKQEAIRLSLWYKFEENV